MFVILVFVFSSRDYQRRLNEGSGNVDPQGNFSIEVLRAALKNRYNLDLPNLGEQGVMDKMDVSEMEGFICNRHEHWFAIRKINGNFWNLNSTLDRPEIISHFRLAKEILAFQSDGYSVFCVARGLPPTCSSEPRVNRQYWWQEADLLNGKTHPSRATVKGAWSNVGSGMRLDGRSTKKPDDLTEEEMVMMAVQESLTNNVSRQKATTVPEEPPSSAPGAVLIQFRLPDGTRAVRRFLESHLVETLFSFVESKVPPAGRRLVLRAGYPPQDLSPQRGKTIGEAQLGNASIQGRYM